MSGDAADRDERWDAGAIRALRERLGASQQTFAERLGTRQQTVSEWECGSSHPRRMARRLLTLIAESEAPYDVSPSGPSSAPPPPDPAPDTPR